MALDELHARRLATVVTLIENALERMEMTLRGLESGRDDAPGASSFTSAQMRRIRQGMDSVRKHLEETVKRFSPRRQRPEPRQALAAELSSLWIVLENALPERMRGYGREFAPEDRADWERQIRALLRDIEHIRVTVLERKTPPRTGA